VIKETLLPGLILCIFGVRALTQQRQIAEQQITENPDLRMHRGSTVVTGSDRRKKSNLGEI